MFKDQDALKMSAAIPSVMRALAIPASCKMVFFCLTRSATTPPRGAATKPTRPPAAVIQPNFHKNL